nr:unnamed protein product [Naegleria fowleri]
MRALKQRIKVKLGKAESTQDPEGYLELRDQVQKTEKYVKGALKIVRNFCQKSEAITKVQNEVGQYLVESGMQTNDEVGESLMKIGEGLKSLSTIHHVMLVNIVEKFIQPATDFKKDVKDSEQSHKKYDKKRLEFDAQVDLVNGLKQKGDKVDPQKIQAEEEKQQQLDTEKDEAFEEALEETCDVLVKRQTKHLAQLNELLMSFHHFFAEGYTLTHDLKEPLEKLLEKSNKRASSFKQQTIDSIGGGSSLRSTPSQASVTTSQPLKTPTTATSETSATSTSANTSSAGASGMANAFKLGGGGAKPTNGNTTTSSASKESVLCTCRAMYDYDAQESGEISFKEGQTILVYEKDEAGWWKGAVESTPNKVGLFPSNFVVDTSSKASGKTTSALYDYDAQESNELSFKTGDVIEVLEESEGGWFMGRNLSTNKVGLFPSNFTELGAADQ